MATTGAGASATAAVVADTATAFVIETITTNTGAVAPSAVVASAIVASPQSLLC